MAKLNFKYGVNCRKNGNSFAFANSPAVIEAVGDNAYELLRAREFLKSKWANLTKTQQSDDENACILIKEIEGE